MVDFSFIVSLYVSDLPNVTISSPFALSFNYQIRLMNDSGNGE